MVGVVDVLERHRVPRALLLPDLAPVQSVGVAPHRLLGVGGAPQNRGVIRKTAVGSSNKKLAVSCYQQAWMLAGSDVSGGGATVVVDVTDT